MDIILTQGIIVWLLIFIRLSFTLLLIPLFGAANTPNQVKIVFSGLLATIFFATGQYQVGIEMARFDILALAVIFEAINGLLVSFVVLMMMNAVYIAGFMIDMNMGFAMANVISPTDEAEIPITANFYYLLTTILFIATNAHHYVILAFNRLLAQTPLGLLGFKPMHIDGFLTLMQETFVIGFQLAMPIIATILVANIILGMLSKAMPGMNVFMVGMPFKILIGLATLFIILPVSAKIILMIIEKTLQYIEQVITIM